MPYRLVETPGVLGDPRLSISPGAPPRHRCQRRCAQRHGDVCLTCLAELSRLSESRTVALGSLVPHELAYRISSLLAFVVADVSLGACRGAYQAPVITEGPAQRRGPGCSWSRRSGCVASHAVAGRRREPATRRRALLVPSCRRRRCVSQSPGPAGLSTVLAPRKLNGTYWQQR